MRERERIERVMNLIKEFWNGRPDYRFFQLINILEILYSKDNDNWIKTKCGNRIDLFCLEDDKFENWLRLKLSRDKIEENLENLTEINLKEY